jgi:hypothetical protein
MYIIKPLSYSSLSLINKIIIMYIRRKVFSAMENENEEIKYYSTTDYLYEDEHLFSEGEEEVEGSEDDVVLVDKKGRIIGTAAGTAVGAGAGAGLVFTGKGRDLLRKLPKAESVANWARTANWKKNLVKAGAVAIPAAALAGTGYAVGKAVDKRRAAKLAEAEAEGREFSDVEGEDDVVLVDKKGRIIGTASGAALGAGVGAGLAFTKKGRELLSKVPGASKLSKWAKGDVINQLENALGKGGGNWKKNLLKAGAVAIPAAALAGTGYAVGKAVDKRRAANDAE